MTNLSTETFFLSLSIQSPLRYDILITIAFVIYRPFIFASVFENNVNE
jgi:hypothetical protein